MRPFSGDVHQPPLDVEEVNYWSFLDGENVTVDASGSKAVPSSGTLGTITSKSVTSSPDFSIAFNLHPIDLLMEGAPAVIRVDITLLSDRAIIDTTNVGMDLTIDVGEVLSEAVDLGVYNLVSSSYAKMLSRYFRGYLKSANLPTLHIGVRPFFTNLASDAVSFKLMSVVEFVTGRIGNFLPLTASSQLSHSLERSSSLDSDLDSVSSFESPYEEIGTVSSEPTPC